MVKGLVEMGEWKSIKASRRDPGISHVFFGDDLILYSEATYEQANTMQTILRRFCS